MDYVSTSLLEHTIHIYHLTQRTRLIFRINEHHHIYGALKSDLTHRFFRNSCTNKGNNNITELRTILQRESQNS